MSMDFALLRKIAPESDDIAGKGRRTLEVYRRRGDSKSTMEHFAYLPQM